MLFNSYGFLLLFLPVTVAAYFIIGVLCNNSLNGVSLD